MTKLHDLHAAGQSVWLDFIKRDMLESGALASLIDDGLRGLTSNPSIFQKAIEGSSLYDQQIREVLQRDPSTSPAAVFEELAIRDIQGAADLLLPVYEQSAGADGYVSLEVSPHLAHDSERTIAEAHRLWAKVRRPNLMIKVPSTVAGVPALEQLTADGINVNSTLMFSLESYVEIAEAYVRGLQRASDPSGIASVASFFVSRVDTKADAALEKDGSDEAMALRGRIAVANAKLAYVHYQDIFSAERFGELTVAGARPQRVLWASTSTKNPEYRDTLYVDELIGPNTVNTLPPNTIDAFLDHGVIDADALTKGVEEARADIAALADLDIDFTVITDELQLEGVAAFADSYDDLLRTLADRMEALGA
jgi:transaldolase